MKNYLHQIAALRARRILYLYTVAYCVRVMRIHECIAKSGWMLLDIWAIVQDQEIIDAHGGLDNTPAYLVHLRPALKVNGERIIIAQGGVAMGGEYDLTIDLISPNGTQSITNSHIVGNLSIIGISAQRAVVQPQSDPNQQKDAARLSYFKTSGPMQKSVMLTERKDTMIIRMLLWTKILERNELEKGTEGG